MDDAQYEMTGGNQLSQTGPACVCCRHTGKTDTQKTIPYKRIQPPDITRDTLSGAWLPNYTATTTSSGFAFLK